MLIHYVSDLHLEGLPGRFDVTGVQPVDGSDVLVLGGDIVQLRHSGELQPFVEPFMCGTPAREGAGMMKQTIPQAVMIAVTLALVAAPSRASWTTIAPGLDLGDFPIARSAGDATITILRIAPATWSLEFLTPDDTDKATLLTARQWCEQHDLTAAINAGMFAVDFRTHVGFAAARGKVRCEIVNDYQSVAAFDPVAGRGLPPFRIFDLDAPGVTLDTIRRDYGSVVQNLRLIKRPGDNRWQRQDKSWSEAALAEDAQGRILFVFCRTPLTMHDFNEALLGLGLGIVAAQHLDGGPPAQFYVRAGDVERELVGSYETGVRQDEGNVTAWPIPIVLGIRRR